jgi:hypothetical protein
LSTIKRAWTELSATEHAGPALDAGEAVRQLIFRAG